MTKKEVAVPGGEEVGARSPAASGALEVLCEGLANRQISGEMHRSQEWGSELHAFIAGTRRPVVVTVEGGCFRWWRVDGEQVSCPVVQPARAVDMVIHAVSTS